MELSSYFILPSRSFFRPLPNSRATCPPRRHSHLFLSLLRGFDHFMSRPLQCLVLCNEGLVSLHVCGVLSRPYSCLAPCNVCPSSLAGYCLVMLHLVHVCTYRSSTYWTGPITHTWKKLQCSLHALWRKYWRPNFWGLSPSIRQSSPVYSKQITWCNMLHWNYCVFMWRYGNIVLWNCQFTLINFW